METVSEQSWMEVAAVDEFDAADRKLVDLGGEKQIAIFRENGAFFAVGAWCSHQRSSLLGGEIGNGQIVCPLHGAKFDLKTGRNLSLPAVRPIARYDLKVQGGKIYVKA